METRSKKRARVAANRADVDVPEWGICPITRMPMKDPFIDETGNSYEKNAIYRWMSSHGHRSPITQTKISLCHLTPNLRLRDAIHECVNEQNPHYFDNYEPSAPTKQCSRQPAGNTLTFPGWAEMTLFTTEKDGVVSDMTLVSRRGGCVAPFMREHEYNKERVEFLKKWYRAPIEIMVFVLFLIVSVVLWFHLPIWTFLPTIGVIGFLMFGLMTNVLCDVYAYHFIPPQTNSVQ